MLSGATAAALLGTEHCGQGTTSSRPMSDAVQTATRGTRPAG